MALTSTLIDDHPSNTVIYTSSGITAITALIICNTATYNPSSPQDGLTYLTLWAKKSGIAVGAVNQIVNAMPVPAGETVSFDTEKLVLDDGDQIVAYCPVPANLSATVSTLPV